MLEYFQTEFKSNFCETRRAKKTNHLLKQASNSCIYITFPEKDLIYNWFSTSTNTYQSFPKNFLKHISLDKNSSYSPVSKCGEGRSNNRGGLVKFI